MVYSIDLADIKNNIRYESFTTGGPGGQHANRSATGVKAIHVPTGITAIAREHRSQYRNRQLALERLLKKLRERHRPAKLRVPTRIPAYVRKKRLDNKKHRSRLKDLRRKVDSD
ncbi:hypothetical protein CEE37_04570 [candidate division LCP-89 bacterium B3_LCP]|uniref:Prokaryotic-type class I peptide chain release factors domain-containing protein n=1 Tax=candidate division LCP-89 bacterium B3_LCP TaxID=2012998 RepID=A0A532V4C0_UNCL8|nr:MAG: hypothetical protein CEE37_04570 [candidate division LCP-89 bacterium B3_LCP]